MLAKRDNNAFKQNKHLHYLATVKFYIIAGEASGDLHGSNLIYALKHIDENVKVRCWGGDKMEAAGATLVKHYRDLAFMGFAEVVKNLPAIIRNLRFCKSDILSYKPDLLILIDYPGFNLRIAKWAKQQGIRVVYYIAPQVWAWKENRVKTMKRCIDKMLVILPFEQDFFEQKWQWPVTYTGHPLLPVLQNLQTSPIPLSQKPIVALLPGSRKQEIQKMLPVMLEVSKAFPNHQFIVAKAPALEDNFYESFLQVNPNVQMVKDNTYTLLKQAKAALVTSGTATLETALLKVPEIVCYKGSNVSYQIAKRLITIKYISLVNLILDKPLLTELIQNDFTAARTISALKELLFDEVKIMALQKGYEQLQEALSTGKNASTHAAESIFDYANTQS